MFHKARSVKKTRGRLRRLRRSLNLEQRWEKGTRIKLTEFESLSKALSDMFFIEEGDSSGLKRHPYQDLSLVKVG